MIPDTFSWLTFLTNALYCYFCNPCGSKLDFWRKTYYSHMSNTNLFHQAISAALNQDWKKAIQCNLALLEDDPDNIEAHNRLAYAYLKNGNIEKAKSTYKKVLKIDKYNPIATKNLKWLSNLNRADIQKQVTISTSPNIFLEEPGKTKIVTLVNPAPNRILCNLASAQKVHLVPKKHSIEVRNDSETYLGALPDDLSFRLLKLITAGNIYDAYIKNVTNNSISIFIRELKRGKKYHLVPSFTVSVSQPNS